MRLIGYYRCSTDAQGESGLGLEAQESAVRSYAAARGYELVAEVREVASGGKEDRELLAGVLASLRHGDADGLIVARMDRLTRSLRQFAEIAETAQKKGWSLIAADGSIDMTTPGGRAMAGMLAVFAALERDMISTRTREALQAKKRREGKLVGNKPRVDPVVVERIRAERAAGFTYRAIAASLEDDGVATAQGGRWCAGTVRFIAHAAVSE